MTLEEAKKKIEEIFEERISIMWLHVEKGELFLTWEIKFDSLIDNISAIKMLKMIYEFNTTEIEIKVENDWETQWATMYLNTLEIDND